MKLSDYQSVTSYLDHTGQTRYRFRRKGVSGYLPGLPGSDEFNIAYEALCNGQRPKPKASVRTTSKMPSKVQRPAPAEVALLPGAIRPKSFADCYRLMKQEKEWTEVLSPDTREQYACGIEKFLDYPVDPSIKVSDEDRRAGRDPREKWRDRLVSQLQIDHVYGMLEDEGIGPAARKHRLIMIRKLVRYAQRLRWTPYDVTAGISFNPARSREYLEWTFEYQEQFKAAHPVGTPARTCYELCVWLGARRGDVAALRWSDLTMHEYLNDDGEYVMVEGVQWIMEKGHHRRMQKDPMNGTVVLFAKITPELAAALAPLDRTTETILVSSLGTPYNKKSLTDVMKRVWRRAAGLPRGLTLHGLRHALGNDMRRSGVNDNDGMHALGHKNPKHYKETYSRGAEQATGQIRAMDRVLQLREARSRAKGAQLRRVV